MSAAVGITSTSNSFASDFIFKLLFVGGKRIGSVTKMEDILLDFDFHANREDCETFLFALKIHSRYVLHKREA